MPAALSAVPSQFQQLMTSASADGGIGNAIVEHFNHGQVQFPQQGVERHTHSVFKLLENTTRFNEVLQKQVQGLTLRNVDWINDYLFPLVPSDVLTHEKSRDIVMRPMAPEVPSMGTVRVTTTATTRKTVAAATYGIGILMEKVQLRTAEGQEQFAIKVAQMVVVFRQNAAHDALTAMINPDPEEEAYDRMFKRITAIDNVFKMELQFNREVDDFGAAAKDRIGMVEIVNRARNTIINDREGDAPNMIIMDPRLQTLIHFADTKYSEAGPAGPKRAMGRDPDEFMGLRVFNPPEYMPDLDADRAPAITRNQRRIGGWNNMVNRYMGMPEDEYLTALMNIEAFDEDLNRFCEVRFDEGPRHSGRFNEYGMLNNTHYLLAEQGKPDLFNYRVSEDFAGYRVARNFGCMDYDRLSNEACHFIAATACNRFTSNDRFAIDMGINLYESWHTDPKGNPSYLHMMQEAKLNTAEGKVAAGFVAAWAKFYRHLVARFGDRYHPFLDANKCPSVLKVGPTDKGPLVLFESTIGHDSGISAGKSKANQYMVAGNVVDANEGYAQLRDALLAFEEMRVSRGEPRADPVAVLAPIERLFNVLRGAPRAQLYFSSILYNAANELLRYGQVDAAAKAISEIAATIVKTQEEKTAARGAEAWIGETDASLLAELAKHPWRFLASGQVPLPGATFGPVDDVTYLGAANYGTGTYLTPESNFTAIANWVEGVASPHFLPRNTGGVILDTTESYGFFYHEKGDRMPQPKMAKTNLEEAPMPEDDCVPLEHHHFSHESFPFAQRQFKTRVEDATGESDPCIRVARLVFLAAPIRLQTIECMMRHNVCTPFEGLLLRPLKGYVMDSAIVVAGGGNTGKTYYGHVDVQVAVDGANRMMHVNAQWRIHTFVEKPENIEFLAHIAYAAQLGGANNRFMTDADIAKLRAANWIARDRRMSSFIFVLTSIGSAESMYNDIDVRGGNFDDFQDARPPHYDTYLFERESRGLVEMRSAFQGIAYSWRGSLSGANTRCMRDAQFYNKFKPGDFLGKITNTGHHGPVVYDGCARVYRGLEVIDPTKMLR